MSQSLGVATRQAHGGYAMFQLSSIALWVAVVGISLAALGLRLYNLGYYSLWYDEVASVETALRGPHAIFTDRFGWMHIQSAFHYFLIWLFTLPVDPTVTPFFVRLPSALAGALTPLVVYALGQELFGRAQGLLAALLVTLSVTHIDYSQDVRPYAIITLLTAIAVYSLLKAQRTPHSAFLWWLVFTLAMVANLLHSYHALTLVTPTLALYWLWVLAGVWRQRREAGGRQLLVCAGASLLAVGATYVAMALDMMQVPRTSPGLDGFLLWTVVLLIIEVTTWILRFGLDGPLGPLVQLLMMLLSATGLGFAASQGRRGAALLCGLFLVVPTLVLAVFSTNNPVFERYAVFAMPFFFLSAGHGLMSLFILSYSHRVRGLARVGLRVASAGAAGLIVAAFALSAYSFSAPHGHKLFSYRPDYRGTALYLSERAGPQDTVIFADTPGGFGLTITGLYWHETPPATVYDVRDPRLFTHQVKGDVYWVFSHLHEYSSLLDELSQPKHGWSEVVSLDLVLILKEELPNDSTISMVERMAKKIEEQETEYRIAQFMRAGVYQAQGQVDDAVRIYFSLHGTFPISKEYLQTAQGFEARGDDARAWRDGVIAKYMAADLPQAHEWLAGKLAEEGYLAESRVESQIAEGLRR